MIITLTDGGIDADHVKQLQRKGSAQHPRFDENRPSRRCPGQFLWESFEKCYNLGLAFGTLSTAYCVSAWTVTLLLVADWNSQVVSAAVHNYSHLLTPNLPTP